jgi:starch synthase
MSGTFVALRHSRWGRLLRKLAGFHVQGPSINWQARRMKILFATPETSDFVQVGGLAAVSAALPRALQDFADIRVVIPGYFEVLSQLHNLCTVAEIPAYAGLPAFEVGLGHASDGLAYYVVISPGLFERNGTPYGDERGVDWHDNDVRFLRRLLHRRRSR